MFNVKGTWKVYFCSKCGQEIEGKVGKNEFPKQLCSKCSKNKPFPKHERIYMLTPIAKHNLISRIIKPKIVETNP